MTIYVKDSELVIDQRKNESGDVFKGLQVFVTSPMVDGLAIAGSGTITAPKALNVNDMRLEIAGSGDITLAQLTSKNLYMEIAGSGDITLNNLNVDHVKSEIAGSGNVILRGKVGSHDEEIAGSGKVNVSGLKN